MKAQRRGGGIALPILNVGCRWRWMVNATPRPLYPGGGDPISIVGER